MAGFQPFGLLAHILSYLGEYDTPLLPPSVRNTWYAYEWMYYLTFAEHFPVLLAGFGPFGAAGPYPRAYVNEYDADSLFPFG